MKKRYMILFCILALSCSKGEDVPSQGKCLGEIFVPAEAGRKSVLVNLDGLWSVSSEDSWLSMDVNGRNGHGAFTFSYESNESDYLSSNPARRGAIVIRPQNEAGADTLYVMQKGIPDGRDYSSTLNGSAYIEFTEDFTGTLKVVFANLEGTHDNDAVSAWISSSGADVAAAICEEDVAVKITSDKGFNYGGLAVCGEVTSFSRIMDNPVAVSFRADDIDFVLSDFDVCADDKSRYDALRSLLDNTYDRSDAGNSWIIGGSFYYYSAFETAYPATPDWYPSDPTGAEFEADRYAHTMNLTDAVWMYYRNWTPTWTSDGRSWRPDYVYLSKYIWNRVIDVEVSDCGIPGVTHRTISITIKY